MQGKHLGEIYTDLTYVRGSLRNLGPGLGWTFTLANPPLPLAGAAEQISLLLDGQTVAARRVWIHSGGAIVRASDVTRKAVLTWRVGQESVFWVEGEPVPPGEHEVIVVVRPLGFGEISTTFRFQDIVGESDVALTARERFEQPVALANGQAFVVLNRAGDLSADWNWFGLMTDNGGLYLPPARFLRYLRFGVCLQGTERSLMDSTVTSRLLPGRLESQAEPLPGVVVHRAVFLSPRDAAAVIRFAVANRQDVPVSLELFGDFAAALVPYGLLGVELSTVEARVGSDGIVRCSTPELPYSVALGAGVAPGAIRVSGGHGRLGYHLGLAPGATASLDFAVAGTLDGSDPSTMVQAVLARASTLQEEAAARFRKALDTSYRLESPDPQLNLAWTSARLALEQLLFRHPEIGAGICAGLPRFPNYWGRDSGWAALGLLSAGETGFVRAALENFFSHQIEEDRPEAQAGDFPTIISGPAFMHLMGYGTSIDGPLLLAIALVEYVFQSGDMEFATENFAGLGQILSWAHRQDRDGDGYLEHGVHPGASTSHAIAIPDTTWMDHIDRRKSCSDVQGLFWHALRLGADLADLLGHQAEAAAWRAEADWLEDRFWRDYFPTGADHPYDRLLPDGTGDPTLRPNYAVNLMFATRLAPERAAHALAALDTEAVRATHGIRTLAATESGYDPIGYHHGCVWNLVTGWTAMAALKHGQVEFGYGLVRTLVANLLRDFGQAPELYRGDQPEAFSGCLLQAWSVSVLLQAVGRYLLGLGPDACRGVLEVTPRLPNSWPAVSVRGIRVGGAIVDLHMRSEEIEASNRGTAAVTLRIGYREAELSPGSDVRLPAITGF